MNDGNPPEDGADGPRTTASDGPSGASTTPGSARVYVPVPLQRHPVDVPPARMRPLLPLAVRRAALAARNASRNPAVVASVTAVATVAAQTALRVLEAQRAGRSATGQLVATPHPGSPVGSRPSGTRYVRITEIRSVIVEVRDD